MTIEPLKPPIAYLYLEPGLGGVYTVTSPDVPGMVTEGRTPDEILRNVQKAVDSLKAAWAQLGVEVPPALQGTLSDHPQTIQMIVLA